MDQMCKNFVTIFERNLEDFSEEFIDVKPDISKLNINIVDENKILNEIEIKKEIEDDVDNIFEINIDQVSNFISDEIKVEQSEIQFNNNNSNEIDFEDFIKPEYLEIKSKKKIEIKKEIEKEYSKNELNEINEQNKINDYNTEITKNLETPFECQFCGKYFKNRFNLMYHKRVHERDIPNKSLDNRYILPQKNLKLESKQLNAKNIQFDKNISIANNYAIHNNEKRLSFDYGLKNIFQDDKKENSMLNCEICDKSFGSKSGYLYHQRSKHNLENDGPTYSCEFCNRIFGNKSHLSYHNKTCLLRLQLTEKGDNYNKAVYLKKKCEKINNNNEIKRPKNHDTLFTLIKSSKMKENLGDTLELQNTDNKSESEPNHMLREVLNIPEILIKSEPNDEQLTTINKIINENNLKQFPLKTDNKNESQKELKKPKPFWLVCHDYSKDPDEEDNFKVDLIDFLLTKDKIKILPYNCSHCAKKFTDKRSLIAHSLIHTNEEHIKCPYCDGIFFKKDSNYHRHVRQHIAKDFHCKICNKSFSQEVNLMTHERIHSGLRPYKCIYCGKGFSQQITMIRHVRIHTGEQPYKCYYCDKAFKQVSNLKCHLQMHHRETNIKSALKLFRECKRNERNHPHEKAKILARNLLQRCAAKKHLTNKLVNLTGNIFVGETVKHYVDT